jgi:NAD(P)H-nitrite reductase large subunit
MARAGSRRRTKRRRAAKRQGAPRGGAKRRGRGGATVGPKRARTPGRAAAPKARARTHRESRPTPRARRAAELTCRYLLIGNSAAALAAIDWIRRRDHDGSMVLVNREPGPAYARVALPYFVSGEITLEGLRIRRPADYEAAGVTLVPGDAVAALDPGGRVTLASGRTIRFERCLVATGSECVMPPIRGLAGAPHHFLWTLDDAKRLRRAAERGRSAVVIGGGFIGMLAAEALRKLNIRLTIVEMADQLLGQLLDGEGARRFGAAVAAHGADIRLGTTVEAVARAGQGTVTVRLAGGDELGADLLVVATGVRPAVDCLAGSGIACGRGVLVDARLQTSQPGVFAAGDVAEAPDFIEGGGTVHAIWPTAVDQGRVAGANMAGADLAYPGSLGMNVVELFGVTLAQLGRFREGPGDQAHLLGRPGEASYRKVVANPEGTLVGAVYVGDENGVAEMGVVHAAIKRRERWRDFEPGRPPRFSYASVVARAPHVSA